jgi:hypothetical protein
VGHPFASQINNGRIYTVFSHGNYIILGNNKNILLNILWGLQNQQDVVLGLTNTVLLCFAFEYSEICVKRMLCYFLAMLGFNSKFRLKLD